MPSEELIAEIEQAVEADAVERAAADAAGKSDEEKAAAEVAEVDNAADERITEEEKVAQEISEQEGAAADEVAQEAVAEEEQRVAEAAAEAKAAEIEVTETHISDELLDRAVESGISLTDALAFPNEKQLVRFIERREHRDSWKTEHSSEDPFADLPKLDPDVYEPEVIDMYDKLVGIARKQHETIQALQGRQQETLQAVQAREAEEVERWFDKQVAGLGEDFHEALGVGDYRSLPQGSQQCAKRNALVDQLSVMFAGYKAQGLQAPPREEVFSAAARLVLADEYQAIWEKELAGKLETRATQHIQRAGGRRAASTQTPEEEAAAAVDTFLGKR